MAKVILLTHTPSPDKTVAAAAKLCYSSSDIEGLYSGLSDEKVKSFVGMLAEIGHESPIEHATFTFGIEGVSRSLLAQITRHRIASYSVQSQRYVKIDEFEYVTPPEIAASPEAAEIFRQAMDRDMADYQRLTDILQKKHINTLVESGMDEKEATKKAEKMAIEDARFVLPNAAATKIVMTMNARSLHNFFAHRCCNRAQWEIRDIACQMLKLVSEVSPSLFSKCGPPCLYGACPEGKMTCGKIKQVREYFSDLRKG